MKQYHRNYSLFSEEAQPIILLRSHYVVWWAPKHLQRILMGETFAGEISRDEKLANFMGFTFANATFSHISRDLLSRMVISKDFYRMNPSIFHKLSGQYPFFRKWPKWKNFVWFIFANGQNGKFSVIYFREFCENSRKFLPQKFFPLKYIQHMDCSSFLE